MLLINPFAVGLPATVPNPGGDEMENYYGISIGCFDFGSFGFGSFGFGCFWLGHPILRRPSLSPNFPQPLHKYPS